MRPMPENQGASKIYGSRCASRMSGRGLVAWLLSDLIYTPRYISCSMWPAQNLPSRRFSSVTERDGNKQVRWVTGRENMIWTDME